MLPSCCYEISETADTYQKSKVPASAAEPACSRWKPLNTKHQQTERSAAAYAYSTCILQHAQYFTAINKGTQTDHDSGAYISVYVYIKHRH
eukprot:7365-Heterococcus_DN1.PRE.1